MHYIRFKVNGWMMDGRLFYVLFNSISVKLGRWVGGSERPCAVDANLRLERSPPHAGLEPGTTRSAGHRLTH